MSFPRYSSYKPSGVEWLGDIPAHWEVRRLKQVCRVMPSNVDKKSHEGEQPVLLCNYTDVYYNDQIVVGMDFMPATATPEQIAKFTLRAGDTIITKDSETADDIAAAAFVSDDLPGVVCGYHLAVLRPADSGGGSYFKWLFGGAHAKAAVEVRANGLTRVGLGTHEIENLELALPPVVERRAIANFLDRETAKIDALALEQERLIELLKEKRQAVISHAVTKGMNPDTPMKDSGIEWLGEVPAHWELRRISTISTKITNGYVGPTRDIFVDEGVRYLQSLHIKGNRIVFDVPYFVSPAWSELHAKSILNLGDVLVVQTGDIGQAAAVTPEFEGCNCHALIVISPLRNVVDGEWLSWVFNSEYGKQTLLSIQTGALHPHLNCGDVKDVVVPVAPLSEQRMIVSRLTGEIHGFDELLAQARNSIELLGERRTALISAAVTGQIDVRPESMRTAA